MSDASFIVLRNITLTKKTNPVTEFFLLTLWR